ncbi:MAG: hypothetical protein AAGA30_08245 [Planctomycetota bacterium]
MELQNREISNYVRIEEFALELRDPSPVSKQSARATETSWDEVQDAFDPQILVNDRLPRKLARKLRNATGRRSTISE